MAIRIGMHEAKGNPHLKGLLFQRVVSSNNAGGGPISQRPASEIGFKSDKASSLIAHSYVTRYVGILE